MIANQRRFIRLEEIQEKTPFTKGDILDFIENGTLTFSAVFKPDTPIKLGAMKLKNREQLVYATFVYDGVVGLSVDDSKKFALRTKPQWISFVFIKELEKVRYWKSISGSFGKIEHSRISYEDIETFPPSKEFWASSKIEVSKSMEQSITNRLAGMLAAVDKTKEIPPELKPDNNDYLSLGSIKIEPDFLRLDLHQIQRELLSSSDELANSKKEQAYVETHPIKLIIERILLRTRDVNSAQVWNILRKDVNGEGKKEFDIDNVIFEITSENLSYFGLGDVTKTISYRRFQNLVSEVRKLHG